MWKVLQASFILLCRRLSNICYIDILRSFVILRKEGTRLSLFYMNRCGGFYLPVWKRCYYVTNAKRMKLKYSMIMVTAVYHVGMIWQILTYLNRTKVAVITDGNSDIGLATAQQFVSDGAYVFIKDRGQPFDAVRWNQSCQF